MQEKHQRNQNIIAAPWRRNNRELSHIIKVPTSKVLEDWEIQKTIFLQYQKMSKLLQDYTIPLRSNIETSSTAEENDLRRRK